MGDRLWLSCGLCLYGSLLLLQFPGQVCILCASVMGVLLAAEKLSQELLGSLLCCSL